jgi:MCM P-loop domain
LILLNRYTANLVPRSVYTSGKSSSAAGLTATVAKEPETGEFCIEVQITCRIYLLSFLLDIADQLNFILVGWCTYAC